MITRLLLILGLLVPVVLGDARAAVVGGTLVKWHEVMVDFAGPAHSEMDVSPNPFLDYRLQVRFTSPGGSRTYDVPGFFDGDGNGGGTGATWRVRFTPDEAGTWGFEASFRTGTNIAVSLDPSAGSATAFDGASGTFDVTDLDPSAPGFLRYGRLESIGDHHLKFRDGGYWVKLGTNNPENFLGYSGFDNTPNAWHSFANHVQDWNPGDPDWNSPDTPSSSDGRGIIGALNYLAAQGLNSIYFMPMNIGADGKDTWPYADPNIDRNGSSGNDNKHLDISKLTQWEIVFDHAQRKGIFLHWVLSDKTAANKNELDNATLGVERKLFYRELVARFAHHNAMQWNLCEEYNLELPLDPAVIKQFGEYLAAVDPYDHPITVHPHGNTYKQALAPFLAEAWFKVMSVQTWQQPESIGSTVEYFRDETTAVGNPIPVNLDESIGMNQISSDEYRKRTFWDALLSGGGFEMFKSYGDSDLDDFRVYQSYYGYARHALRFVQENLLYWRMEPDDTLVTGDDGVWGGAEVFSEPGEMYAIYLPKASPAPSLSLEGAVGTFEATWYDPRTGTFAGSPVPLQGGSIVGLGSPPSDPNEDWAVLVRLVDAPPERSNGQPSGTLPEGTAEVTISLDTDVDAECRYDPLPGTGFDSMAQGFATTGGTSHASPVDGLADGRAAAYYVRCQSGTGVTNADDYAISFSVDAGDGRPIGDRAVWYLDEGAGMFTSDSSGQGNLGELVGSPEWTIGHYGNAIHFDGSNDHVRVASSPALDFSLWSGATVALWVRPERTAPAEEQTLYGHWNADAGQRPFQILLTVDNLPRCRTNHDDGYSTSPSPAPVGTWTHVACTWEPSGLVLYVDGQPVATDDTVAPSLAANDGTHTLGARDKNGSMSQFFQGVLDEVHVFDRALSGSEVLALFQSDPCMDADADGLRRCDGDCDDTNPECSLDCTDGDGDGICAPADCDDGTPSAGTVPFGQTILAANRDAFTWPSPADIRWRRGTVSELAAYLTLEAGSADQAVSLDVAGAAPGPGEALYFLVRSRGCGSWQGVVGAAPGRDQDLPLP